MLMVLVCGQTARGRLRHTTRAPTRRDVRLRLALLFRTFHLHLSPSWLPTHCEHPCVQPRFGTCWDVSSDATLKHDGGGDSLGIAYAVRYALQNLGIDPFKVALYGEEGEKDAA